MDMNEQLRWIRDALNRAHVEYQLRQGKPASQAEFARFLGVPETSYSAWINERRLPNGDNIYKLGEVLGSEFYDIMGLPPHMPNDPRLRQIVEIWKYLDDDKQDQVLGYINEHAENPNTGVARSSNEGRSLA